jgi:hypothetical protein
MSGNWEAKKMTTPSRQFLFWSPRVLSILYIAFLSMFSLDVFGEKHGFWPVLVALTIHLIPSLILIVGLILAWRWEWIGTAIYATAGALYISLVMPRAVSPALKLNWILIISAPAFVVAALFLANWLKHAELHGGHP